MLVRSPSATSLNESVYYGTAWCRTRCVVPQGSYISNSGLERFTNFANIPRIQEPQTLDHCHQNGGQ